MVEVSRMLNRVLALLLVLSSGSGTASAAAAAPETIATEQAAFGAVEVYRPPVPPAAVVLFLSGDGGWNLGVVGMAEALSARGAIVIGVDTNRYLAAVGKEAKTCVSLAEDLEALAHFVEKRLGLAEYRKPILAGYSSGATLVYAALAQSPPGTFAGAISLGFCADQDMRGARPCREAALTYASNPRGGLLFEPAGRLEDPWIVLQGQQDQVCDAGSVDTFAQAVSGAEVVRLPAVGHGFSVERNWLPQLLASYDSLSGRARASDDVARDLADLPLTEVIPAGAPVRGPGADANAFALLLTGDGGWAGLDKDVSAALAAQHIPVVALNSLRYYWKRRSPEEAAADAARIIEHYSRRLSRSRVVLMGYSFGADVLPFIVNRLPEQARARIERIVLIGPSRSAVFEVKVRGWIPGLADEGLPLAPELARLDAERILCIHGAEERESGCPALAQAGARGWAIGAGHHFGGDYGAVAQAILEFLR